MAMAARGNHDANLQPKMVRKAAEEAEEFCL